MLPEEGELEIGLARLGFRQIPLVVWSLRSCMDLDGKSSILALLGSHAVL